MTISAHSLLLAGELLLAASPGAIAAWLVWSGRSLRPAPPPTEADPEMLQLAAWSDELAGVNLTRGSCEL